MSTAQPLTSPFNSTNVRFLLETLSHRLRLRIAATLAPSFADAWAERLFLTPPRLGEADDAAYDLSDGVAGAVAHRGRRLATWTWGPRDAPAVLLVHGWGGRAAQLRHFIYPLRGYGYRVVTFDQPAHGRSEGRLSGLPDFAEAVAQVATQAGGVRALIAHSLGAPAAAYAAAHGLAIEAAVLVSPPTDLVGYSRRFARWLGMPEWLRDAMQAAIEERYGVRWTAFDLERLGPRMDARALVVHDRDDRHVPLAQGRRFANAWPGARMLETQGLGHGRILSADPVVRAAAAFIAGRSQVASHARPALPDPSPFY